MNDTRVSREEFKKSQQPCCTTDFDQVLEVARLLKAYLAWEGCRPKTALSSLRLSLAGYLIGKKGAIKDGKYCWRFLEGGVERTNRRLRSAGIDPKDWRIVSQRRAAFAWKQLRESGVFREGEQERLVKSDIPTPSLLETIKFDWNALAAKRDKAFEEEKRKKALNHQHSEAIKERINWSR